MSEEENKTTEEELIAVRREKLSRLRELGVNPFGGKYDVESDIYELRNSFKEGEKARIAGRITAHRDMGRVISLMSLISVVGSSAI